MDSRDSLPPFVNGVDCAVCGQSVPVEGIKLLARRDDLTFVEVACAGCRSESLGIIVAGEDEGGSIAYGEFLPADDARFRDALPIGADDVLEVRELLDRHGLAGLVDGADGFAAGGSQS
jgi:hypothetical protein